MTKTQTIAQVSPAVAADQDRLLSVAETRQKLGVSHVTVYNLFKRGALPSLHIGRSRRVRLSDVVAFMSGTANSSL